MFRRFKVPEIVHIAHIHFLSESHKLIEYGSGKPSCTSVFGAGENYDFSILSLEFISAFFVRALVGNSKSCPCKSNNAERCNGQNNGPQRTP